MTRPSKSGKIYNNIGDLTLISKNKKYMMIENKKHYCAENQRIASKMGSGCESKDCINRNDTNDRNDTKFHAMLSALQGVTIPAEDSLQVVFSGDKIDHLG